MARPKPGPDGAAQGCGQPGRVLDLHTADLGPFLWEAEETQAGGT